MDLGVARSSRAGGTIAHARGRPSARAHRQPRSVEQIQLLVDLLDDGLALQRRFADVADEGAEEYEWLSWGMPFESRRGGPVEGRGTPKKWEWGTSLFPSSISCPCPRLFFSLLLLGLFFVYVS